MKKITVLSAKALIWAVTVGVLLNSGLAQSRSKRVVVSSAPAEISRSNSNADENERQIFEAINQERRKKGLSELEWRSDLSYLARSYSQKMVDGNFFSHYETDGTSVVERARAMRIKNWTKIGENLFECEGYDNFNSLAVKSWMKSPGHRENILDANFNATGLGSRSRETGRFISPRFLSGSKLSQNIKND